MGRRQNTRRVQSAPSPVHRRSNGGAAGAGGDWDGDIGGNANGYGGNGGNGGGGGAARIGGGGAAAGAADGPGEHRSAANEQRLDRQASVRFTSSRSRSHERKIARTNARTQERANARTHTFGLSFPTQLSSFSLSQRTNALVGLSFQTQLSSFCFSLVVLVLTLRSCSLPSFSLSPFGLAQSLCSRPLSSLALAFSHARSHMRALTRALEYAAFACCAVGRRRVVAAELHHALQQHAGRANRAPRLPDVCALLDHVAHPARLQV